MPEVLRTGKFVFRFFSNECQPREPVHVHVFWDGGDSEAKVWIDPAIRIERRTGGTRKDERDILELVRQNENTIRDKWNEHFGQ